MPNYLREAITKMQRDASGTNRWVLCWEEEGESCASSCYSERAINYLVTRMQAMGVVGVYSLELV